MDEIVAWYLLVLPYHVHRFQLAVCGGDRVFPEHGAYFLVHVYLLHSQLMQHHPLLTVLVLCHIQWDC